MSFYLEETVLSGQSSLTQASGSINNLYEISEQPENYINVNTSLHNQKDSLFVVSRDQVLKSELQQWDIKPDPYSQLKQELTPGLGVKSELPASTLNLSQNDQCCQDHKAIVSTQHQENQEDISMAFSKEYYNGL